MGNKSLVWGIQHTSVNDQTANPALSSPTPRPVVFLLAAGIVCLAAALLGMAVTAANTVPASNLSSLSYNATVTDLKPNACNATAQTVRLVGNANIAGGASAEVILGGPGNQTITGANGNDCIMGGGGVDAIDCGGGAADIALTGPGADTNTGGRCETFVQ